MTDQQIVFQPVVVDWRGGFCGWLAAQGKAVKTVQAYLSDLGRYARWFQDDNGVEFSPDLLTGVDLRAYREYSIDVEQVQPSTWNRRRISLAVFCQWAQAMGFVAYDPFQGVEPQAAVELAPRWLEKAEQNRILRQVELMVNGAKTAHWRWQAARDQAMIAVMIFAGLREDEVCNLNIEHIELSSRSGRVVVRRGKGGKRREVPLNAEARRALVYWLGQRCAASGEEPVFIGKQGGDRLSPRQVQRRVKEIGSLAGVEDVTPHRLRHTFSKRVLDGGGELTELQKLLGHERLETTARYVKPGWSDLERAVNHMR